MRLIVRKLSTMRCPSHAARPRRRGHRIATLFAPAHGRFWHIADKPTASEFVRSWGAGSAAISVVRCRGTGHLPQPPAHREGIAEPRCRLRAAYMELSHGLAGTLPSVLNSRFVSASHSWQWYVPVCIPLIGDGSSVMSCISRKQPGHTTFGISPPIPKFWQSLVPGVEHIFRRVQQPTCGRAANQVRKAGVGPCDGPGGMGAATKMTLQVLHSNT
jgi:hypothetical protein